MAATWKQSITTSAGIALMNKAYGVSSIIPTKAVTITDDISGLSVTQVMALTSVNYNQSRVPIVISNQANTTRIGIDIDNKDVNEQYDYYGIGVYFKQVNTGEEVLFSVIPLSGAATIIPNQSGVATSSISIDSYTSIVPGTNVDLTVSDSGSVTRADVEQIVATNQSFSFPKKPLATGIDLQSIKSIGIYQINDDKTVVNAPDGFSGNGYVIVIGDGTTANPITQDLFDTVTGNKYSNSYDSDGNKWTGWEEMASKSDVTTILNNGLSTKVTDNKDGTIQFNGTQVNPYNKLSDTIGGRNLLLGTSSVKVQNSTWNNTFNVDVTNLVGTTLTYSAILDITKSSQGTVAVSLSLQDSSGKAIGDTVPSNPINFGNVGKAIATITIPVGASNLKISEWTNNTNSNPWVGSRKLEKGSIATDWTPAPEDKVNVSDMRKPASDVAGIEEVSTLQTQVDDSAVGTNLLTNTGDLSANWFGATSISTTTEYNGHPSMEFSSSTRQLGAQQLGLGELQNSIQYTASFWAKADNAGDRAHTELWGSIGNTDFVLTTNWVRYAAVVTSYSDANTNTDHFGCFFGVPDGNTGNVYIALPKLELGSHATDWCPNPEDKVNVADMRKPASDVAGIDEVNTKQDKIGYTPADDSKVVHTADTSNWQKQKITNDDGTPFVNLYASSADLSKELQQLSAGFYTIYANPSVTNNPLNGISGVKGFVNIQSTGFGSGTLIGYESTSQFFQYSVWVTNRGVTYTLLANDSKVAHLVGTNNFSTVPTVNNNPLLLASSLPSDLARTGSDQEFTGKNIFDTAPIDKKTGNPYITKDGVPSDVARTSQQTNFTAGLQSGGVDVATAADLNNYYHANASDDAALAAAKSATVPGIFWFEEV